jgi:hypothetical protein
MVFVLLEVETKKQMHCWKGKLVDQRAYWFGNAMELQDTVYFHLLKQMSYQTAQLLMFAVNFYGVGATPRE